MSYCSFVNALPADTTDPNKHYHDHVYGFPLADDNALFGRLLLEINQAGLSWTLMLKKQAAFRAAYSNFNIAAVAAYQDADRARLLADAGIVRNRRKIAAVIYNCPANLPPASRIRFISSFGLMPTIRAVYLTGLSFSSNTLNSWGKKLWVSF